MITKSHESCHYTYYSRPLLWSNLNQSSKTSLIKFSPCKCWLNHAWMHDMKMLLINASLIFTLISYFPKLNLYTCNVLMWTGKKNKTLNLKKKRKSHNHRAIILNYNDEMFLRSDILKRSKDLALFQEKRRSMKMRWWFDDDDRVTIWSLKHSLPLPYFSIIIKSSQNH